MKFTRFVNEALPGYGNYSRETIKEMGNLDKLLQKAMKRDGTYYDIHDCLDNLLDLAYQDGRGAAREDYKHDRRSTEKS